MTEIKRKLNTYKIPCLFGSILLIVMAVFHGSGFQFVSIAIEQSNAKEFLKEIVPALFIHPSIHLIGMATFGFLALFTKHDTKKILIVLSVLVSIDAFLAFYLGGLLPGILLLAAASLFIIASLKINQNK